MSDYQNIEIDNIEKILKSGPHGLIEVNKDEINHHLIKEGPFTFIGDKTITIVPGKIDFIEFTE